MSVRIDRARVQTELANRSNPRQVKARLSSGFIVPIWRMRVSLLDLITPIAKPAVGTQCPQQRIVALLPVPQNPGGGGFHPYLPAPLWSRIAPVDFQQRMGASISDFLILLRRALVLGCYALADMSVEVQKIAFAQRLTLANNHGRSSRRPLARR